MVGSRDALPADFASFTLSMSISGAGNYTYSGACCWVSEYNEYFAENYMSAVDGVPFTISQIGVGVFWYGGSGGGATRRQPNVCVNC